MIVITGHSNGGDGILFVSQASTPEEAFEELRFKTGGTIAQGTLDDDPDETVDVLLGEGKKLNDDGSIPRHNAWAIYASVVNDNGFGEATW